MYTLKTTSKNGRVSYTNLGDYVEFVPYELKEGKIPRDESGSLCNNYVFYTCSNIDKYRMLDFDKSYQLLSESGCVLDDLILTVNL